LEGVVLSDLHTAKIQHYLDTITKRYAAGISTEHSYRADLQNLLYAICGCNPSLARR